MTYILHPGVTSAVGVGGRQGTSKRSGSGDQDAIAFGRVRWRAAPSTASPPWPRRQRGTRGPLPAHATRSGGSSQSSAVKGRREGGAEASEMGQRCAGRRRTYSLHPQTTPPVAVVVVGVGPSRPRAYRSKHGGGAMESPAPQHTDTQGTSHTPALPTTGALHAPARRAHVRAGRHPHPAAGARATGVSPPVPRCLGPLVRPVSLRLPSSVLDLPGVLTRGTPGTTRGAPSIGTRCTTHGDDRAPGRTKDAAWRCRRVLAGPWPNAKAAYVCHGHANRTYACPAAS